MKYRKKPLVIEAIQWTGFNTDEISKFVGIRESKLTEHTCTLLNCLTIPTRAGDMTVLEGDYVIKGIAGEFYPCEKNIFERSYEISMD